MLQGTEDEHQHEVQDEFKKKKKKLQLFAFIIISVLGNSKYRFFSFFPLFILLKTVYKGLMKAVMWTQCLSTWMGNYYIVEKTPVVHSKSIIRNEI